MPHVSSSGGDDLAPSDEVKVYKDEGEEENPSSENLAEDKVGLVTETEEGKTSESGSGEYSRNGKDGPSVNGKSDQPSSDRPIWNPLLSPYPYHSNGASLPTSLGPPGFPSSFYINDRPFGSPPPAHMGIPPVHIDPKTGLPRPMYTIPPPPGQFPFYPELSTVNWNGPGGYPITTTGLRGPYPPLSSSPLSRFSPPGLLPPHPGLPPGFPHPGLMAPGPKQDLPPMTSDHRTPPSINNHHSNDTKQSRADKRMYVKKPLNAFMLFMKEMRQKVIDDCTLKESAAINQILGRKWHSLDRSEQAKYYEMARKEKELHMQLYPGWSARDNYGSHTKKKKRKKPMDGCGDGMSCNKSDSECANPKKCRARFGLDQQNQWCKPCRRKKKCIRFLEEGGVYSEDDDDDDHQGSVASTTDADSGHGSPQPSGSISSTDENRNENRHLLHHHHHHGNTDSKLRQPPMQHHQQQQPTSSASPSIFDIRPLPEARRTDPRSHPPPHTASSLATGPLIPSSNMVLAT